VKYIRIEGDRAFVQLSRGYEAIIDAADVPLIGKRSWFVIPNGTGGFYARASDRSYMHRVLTGAPLGTEVDHLNRDTLDNRRANLPVGTHQANMLNSAWALTRRCPAGHLYDEANTRVDAKGHRKCRACHREWERARAARRRETAVR